MKSSSTSVEAVGADEYRDVVSFRLPQSTVKELSTLNQWRSGLQVVLEWLGIAGVMLLANLYPSIPLYVFAVIWIGSRQHALTILMHEAAHNRLFKNKRLNDIVGEVFCAWPLLVTMKQYRKEHFAHHRYVNTENDPDWVRKQGREWTFPMSRAQLAWMLFKDVTGLNTHQQVMEAFSLGAKAEPGASQDGERTSSVYLWSRLSFYILVAASLTVFHGWLGFLILWIVPILTWMKMVLRIRSIAEHYATENTSAFARTRTTITNLFGRLFIAPINISYHLEHHLYPSVPFYRLPKLHAMLLEHPEYQQKAHITYGGYLNVARECVKGASIGRAPKLEGM